MINFQGVAESFDFFVYSIEIQFPIGVVYISRCFVLLSGSAIDNAGIQQN